MTDATRTMRAPAGPPPQVPPSVHPRPEWHRWLGATIPAAAAVLVVAFAANTSPKGHTQSARLTSLGVIGDVVGVLIVVLVTGVGGIIVRALWPDRRRKDPDAPEWVQVEYPETWWERALDMLVVLAICAAIVAVLVLLVLHFETPGPRRSLTLPVTGPSLRPMEPAAPHSPATTPGAVTLGSAAIIGVAAAVFALVGLLGLIMRRLTRRSAEPLRRLHSDGTELRRAAGRALVDMATEPDPRRAILKAYAALEGGAVVKERTRAPSEAPLEYLDRLLDTGVPARPAARLTALFESARFSNHVMASEDRDEAIGALEDLRSGSESTS